MYGQEGKDLPPYDTPSAASAAGSNSPSFVRYQTPVIPAGPVYAVDHAGLKFYPAPVPLRDLGHVEALVDCPYCGARGSTKTKPVAGNMNHAWAGCLFFTTFIFTCVPYLCNSLKNVEHRCRGCGKRLAVWHRSGRTETN